MMNEKDLSYGQPKLKEASEKKTSDMMFKLGRVAANIERDREELKKETMLSLTQQVMLQQERMKIEDDLAKLSRMQDDLIANQMAALPQNMPGGPPMGGDMGMGGYPMEAAPLPSGPVPPSLGPEGSIALPPEPQGGGFPMQGGPPMVGMM